jgi:hypothetical protein
MIKKKYDISGFWGLMTEEEAIETLRYIRTNMHEADPYDYNYERSTQHPHLFLIYAIIEEDD